MDKWYHPTHYKGCHYLFGFAHFDLVTLYGAMVMQYLISMIGCMASNYAKTETKNERNLEKEKPHKEID